MSNVRLTQATAAIQVQLTRRNAAARHADMSRKAKAKSQRVITPGL